MNSFAEFFNSKNALVIGGSGGIGKEISLALKACGANVTVQGAHEGKGADIVLDFTKINLEELCAPSTSNGCAKPTFLQSTNSLAPLQAALQAADILCICYGPFLQKSLQDTTPREWLDITKLNLALPGILASYAAPFMRARGFGRILFFGGTRTNTINGFKTNAAYAAAKTGVASLTKSFALEFGKYGITANAIFPGFVETEYITPEQKKHYEQLLGGKMISPKDVAQKALFLLSESEFNGNLLEFDRGWTL